MLIGSEEERTATREEYHEKNTAVKKSARRDKREHADTLAMEAQLAEDRGDIRTVYKISKTLTGGFTNRTLAVRDKNGQVLAMEENGHNRRAEHFRENLNRPDPEEEATIKNTGFHIEMKLGRHHTAEHQGGHQADKRK